MNATRTRSDAAPTAPQTLSSRRRWRTWIAAGLAALGLAASAPAQDAPQGPLPDYAKWIIEGKGPPAESGIQQAGCCGNDLSPTPMITGGPGPRVGDCPPGCNTGHCIPGRKCPTQYPGCRGNCSEHTGKLGRFCDNLFECFCCPDHCYEPQWYPAANSGFWIDHARPQSQLLFRWDLGMNMVLPDRNEFFWARIKRKGPQRVEDTLNYHQYTMYSETAVGGFGFFVEGPYYRLLESDANGFDAGWGDMNIGTKSMFVDCEMLQMTFQFRTWIPVGASIKGFGNGHVTLEPSLLATLKLCPDWYLESQIAEWIPIAGDPDMAGMVFRYNTSLNHVWCRKKSMQLIGSLEYFGYAFQDGAFTLPFAVQGDIANPAIQKSSREAYHYIAPGMRVCICDKFDIGFGAAFSLSDEHFGDQWYRTEVRIRY